MASVASVASVGIGIGLAPIPHVLENRYRYCLTIEKRFVATAESPVTEWPIAIAHSAVGEFAPYLPNLPPTIP